MANDRKSMAVLEYVLVFILLVVSLNAYFRIAYKFRITDKPNGRSSHTSLTLRGGGIVFLISSLIGFVVTQFQYPHFIAGLVLIAFVSFADDIKPLSSKIRLPIHFAAMALMMLEVGVFELNWYIVGLVFVLSVGIINAYNFMDGINGMTGAYTLTVLIALGYVNSMVVEFVEPRYIYFMLMAVVVFNYYNFRKKARCFAGDVGSVTIAFFIVFLLVKLIVLTGDLRYVLFVGVYGVDAVLTILHRILLKENIFKAHRKHAYQLMANELKIPHLIVSLFYALLQSLIIVLTLIDPAVGFVAIMMVGIAYIVFKCKYYKLHCKL